MGGAVAADLFARHGLLRELRLFTVPVFLGAGPELFREGFSGVRATLCHLERFPSGVTEARYALAPAGA